MCTVKGVRRRAGGKILVATSGETGPRSNVVVERFVPERVVRQGDESSIPSCALPLATRLPVFVDTPTTATATTTLGGGWVQGTVDRMEEMRLRRLV